MYEQTRRWCGRGALAWEGGTGVKMTLDPEDPGFCGQRRGDLGSQGGCRQGCETGALATLGAWDKRVPEGIDDGAAFGAWICSRSAGLLPQAGLMCMVSGLQQGSLGSSPGVTTCWRWWWEPGDLEPASARSVGAEDRPRGQHAWLDLNGQWLRVKPEGSRRWLHGWPNATS